MAGTYQLWLLYLFPVGGVCADPYVMTANRNANNGILQSSHRTKDACKSACNSDPLCYGLDFDRTITLGCFFFRDQNYQLNTVEKIGTNHYRKRPECGGKSTAGA